MPNRTRRNSVVDQLAKVPVNRGSLLKSIENLLKTIESSESAVMIPTLLRDKCDFDAWELLFVAKILKASILGHSDLVEFYMNHIGHSSNQFAQPGDQNQQQQQQQQQHTSMPSPSTTVRSIVSPVVGSENGRPEQTSLPVSNSVPLPVSDKVSHMKGTQSGSPASSSAPISNGQTVAEGGKQTNGWMNQSANQQLSSGISSNSFSSTNGTSVMGPQLDGIALSMSSTGISSSPPSSVSSASSSSSSSTSASSSASSSSSSSSASLASISSQQETAGSGGEFTQESLLTNKPLLMRQAQPPSLLQLTTTNNHINSVAAVAAGFTNNNIEQLSNQLTGAANAPSSPQSGPITNGSGGGGSLDGALSISTSSANQQSQSCKSLLTAINGMNAGASVPIQQVHPHPELRSSRSAGCLYRINSSGASSPRTPAQTPTTPYPQAETLANGLANGLAGDPSTPVKLLLQIEQLKSSISHVTSLLESVVELYKKSIDNIAS